MSSTNRTENLGLSNWLETDRPKRTDFVSDNLIIDNALGGHINDTTQHLTSTEKAFLTQPFVSRIIYGTGTESGTVHLSFPPNLVIVTKIGASPTQYSGGVVRVNYAVATPQGASMGIRVSGNDVILSQDSTAQDGAKANLNEEFSQYLMVAFR